MSADSEFFFDSFSSVVELDLLEISHSSFSQTFYLVRNAVDGVTVTHENASVIDYTYCPMQLSLSGPREDLDHILNVVLGDVSEYLAPELDAIRNDGTTAEMPVVKYRTYRSDDLSAPMYGPIDLQIKRLGSIPEGFLFEAKAPSLNVNKTGEKYTISRFPALTGLL
jgi:hypothetical protein